jgi:hypothetical protein
MDMGADDLNGSCGIGNARSELMGWGWLLGRWGRGKA